MLGDVLVLPSEMVSGCWSAYCVVPSELAVVAVGVRTYQGREQLKKSFHMGNAQAVSLLVDPSEVAGGCGWGVALCHPR